MKFFGLFQRLYEEPLGDLGGGGGDLSGVPDSGTSTALATIPGDSSAPAASASLVNSTACAVALAPAPAMTGMRPRDRATAVRMSSLCSPGLSVAASPVVPQTTSAVAPLAICRSQSRSNAATSMFPSSLKGVGSAGAYPDSFETCRPIAVIVVRRSGAAGGLAARVPHAAALRRW